MKEFLGTPAPWKVGANDIGVGQNNITVDAPHEKRAYVAILIDYDGMPVQANAALIAAAPDLLKACINAVETFRDIRVGDQHDALIEELQSAITKALTI